MKCRAPRRTIEPPFMPALGNGTEGDRPAAVAVERDRAWQDVKASKTSRVMRMHGGTWKRLLVERAQRSGDRHKDARAETRGCSGTIANGETPRPQRPQCIRGRCFDGVCCDSECDGACETCAAPGSEGRCSASAVGSNDSQCPAGRQCAGRGQCLLPLGSACSLNGDCRSGECGPALQGGGEICCEAVCANGQRCSAAGSCVNAPRADGNTAAPTAIASATAASPAAAAKARATALAMCRTAQQECRPRFANAGTLCENVAPVVRGSCDGSGNCRDRRWTVPPRASMRR